VCGDDSVLATAVEEAITKAGPRGNEERIRAKRLAVKQAMAELEKLEKLESKLCLSPCGD